MTDPHTYVDGQAEVSNLPSEHALGYAFLSGQELWLFRQLIHARRPLPVYRAGRWVCYECAFESTDLGATARHIVRAHGAAPANEDDWDGDDSDSAN